MIAIRGERRSVVRLGRPTIAWSSSAASTVIAVGRHEQTRDQLRLNCPPPPWPSMMWSYDDAGRGQAPMFGEPFHQCLLR